MDLEVADGANNASLEKPAKITAGVVNSSSQLNRKALEVERAKEMDMDASAASKTGRSFDRATQSGSSRPSSLQARRGFEEAAEEDQASTLRGGMCRKTRQW
jgi:hypothetical protein